MDESHEDLRAILPKRPTGDYELDNLIAAAEAGKLSAEGWSILADELNERGIYS